MNIIIYLCSAIPCNVIIACLLVCFFFLSSVSFFTFSISICDALSFYPALSHFLFSIFSLFFILPSLMHTLHLSYIRYFASHPHSLFFNVFFLFVHSLELRPLIKRQHSYFKLVARRFNEKSDRFSNFKVSFLLFQVKSVIFNICDMVVMINKWGKTYSFKPSPNQQDGVVYFDQRFGAAHSQCWSKYLFLGFLPIYM